MTHFKISAIYTHVKQPLNSTAEKIKRALFNNQIYLSVVSSKAKVERRTISGINTRKKKKTTHPSLRLETDLQSLTGEWIIIHSEKEQTADAHALYQVKKKKKGRLKVYDWTVPSVRYSYKGEIQGQNNRSVVVGGGREN